MEFGHDWHPQGVMPSGPLGSICDVPGVTVGHCAIDDKEKNIYSGVTAICPSPDSPYENKLPAAVHIINGYGKSAGLMQVGEMGCIETPLVLVNTLAVGVGFEAVVTHMLKDHLGIGGQDGTVNPIVLECNDGYLSDVRERATKPEHVHAAINAADVQFEQGAAGAGRGMVCYGLKGGIGTASRIVELPHGSYTMGCLVLTNFGALENLTIAGNFVGKQLNAAGFAPENGMLPQTGGSVIVVLATDAPLSSRQLARICRRVPVGISRTGAYIASGSGEIALAFSVANRIPYRQGTEPLQRCYLGEGSLNGFFSATAQVVEEAILSSLYHGKTTEGRDGHRVWGLRDALAKVPPQQAEDTPWPGWAAANKAK